MDTKTTELTEPRLRDGTETRKLTREEYEYWNAGSYDDYLAYWNAVDPQLPAQPAPRAMSEDIRYTPRWWARSVLHNMVVHPMLPLADLLDAAGFRRAAQVVYAWHDNSAPVGAG